MSYFVRCYLNSGYNALNSPDSPTLLNQSTYIDLQSVEILQDGFLNSVRVATDWNTIKHCDFIMIGEWYYSVINIVMLSVDCAELTLLPDFILSAGGVSMLNFTDGITERVHIPKSDDEFAKYTEQDELINPAYPLEMDYTTVEFTTGTPKDVTLVESSIDLLAMGVGTDGKTYTDPNSGETVTVPIVTSVVAVQTEHEYGGKHGTQTACITDGQGAPSTDIPLIFEGIDNARGLGVESAIIAQYQVPNSMIDWNSSGITGSAVLSTLKANSGMYADLNALKYDFSPSSYTVKNQKALYNDLLTYTILTTGGNKCNFTPEDIYNSGDTYPRILVRADLRSDGCPYFRFRYFKGNDGTSSDDFWINCVAGANWKQVPLVYTNKSGNALDKMQFDAQSDKAISKFLNDEFAQLGEFISNAATAIAVGLENPIAGVAMIGISTAGAISSVLNIQDEYFKQSRNDLLQYATKQIIAPEIQFPYNSDIMRDALGNGAIVYRYKYSNADLERVDKILTMYGYRITKKLENTDFTNRPKFNYVKANGVSVNGTNTTLPKWWCDGISAQLSAGIRFWHIVPDTTVYNTGNE